MSEFITSYRAKYPEYNDISDTDLVNALTNKYNAENNASVSFDEFSQAIGFMSQQAAPIKPVTPAQQIPQEEARIAAPAQGLAPTPTSQQPQMPAMQAPEVTARKSMAQLVQEKVQQISEGVQSGFEGAIPQFKQQVGGMLRQGREFPSREEYEAMASKDLFGDPIPYEQAKHMYETLNPIKVAIGEYGKELAQEGREESAQVAGQFERGTPGYYAEAITGTTINMVPSLGVSIFGRRPDIGLGIMLAQSKGAAYEKGREEGLDTRQAGIYAELQMLAEVVPSAVPIAKFMKPSGKFVQDLVTAGITEGTQEAITAALQAGIDKGYVDPDMTLEQALAQIEDSAIIGLGSGVTISAATSKVAKHIEEKEKVKLVEDALEAEFDKSIAAAKTPEQQAVESLSPEQAQMGAVEPARKLDAPKSPELETKSPEQAVKSPEQIKPIEIKEAEIKGVDLTVEQIADEAPVKQQVTGKEVVEAPIAEITVSADVPQFKEGADVKGVVEPLGGKFERTGVAPIQVWVREDGRKEVISGRHRLDLAQRSGETTIPAQYHYESEGFDVDQAAALDALLNIREGQGKVKDYVDFIQATKLTQEEADAQGILARQTGKRAFVIASQGSDSLITAHRNNQVSDSAAARIAEAAPNKEPLQAVGIKAIQDGRTINDAVNMVRAVKSMAGEQAQETGDLFGFDDSAIKQAEEMAKAASQKQADIKRILAAVQGAAKRPNLAAKEGIDVKDPEAIKKRITELKQERDAWARWETDPKLVAELRGEEFTLEQETEAQRQEREKVQADEAKAEEQKQKQAQDKVEADKAVDDFVLQGSDRPADVAAARGQGDLLAQPEPEPQEQKSVAEVAEDLQESMRRIVGEGKLLFASDVQEATDVITVMGARNISSDVQAAISKVGERNPIVLTAKANARSVTKTATSKQIAEAEERLLEAAKRKSQGPASTEQFKAETKGPVDKYATDPVGDYETFMDSIAEGKATVKSILQDAEALVKNKDSILELFKSRAVTKADLQKIARTPRTDMNKAQFANAAYKQMLSEHVMGSITISYFGGEGNYDEQVMKHIRNQTQADIDAEQERIRQAKINRDKRVEAFKKAMENPETLPEFKEFIRVRGKDKMTPEQLAKYDELVSESLRPEDKPKVVTGETETVKVERAQTKHTKTGADLFVVKLVERVERDKFKELSGKAKQLGGYYSTYAKGDAIPGFQFKTEEAADSFEKLLAGADIDASNQNEAKADVKRANNADKLAAMADKLEAKAEEELSADRLTNTAKRASQAAHATEKAYKKQALAKTVRNIANRLMDGDLLHLSKISQVTQLEALMSIQKLAIPNDLMVSDYDGYSMNYELREGVSLDDYIMLAKMPERTMHNENVTRLAYNLEDKPGFKRFASELRRLPQGTRGNHLRKLDKDQFNKLAEAVKRGHISSYELGFAEVAHQQLGRLERLGITSEEQLRAAIRELDSLKVEKQKEDPVKKLERDLVGKKIEGYFPTPTDLVEKMMDYAEIEAGHDVLEPSAGKGNIAEQVKAFAPDASLDVIEFNSSLRAILEAKGYNVVANDFTGYADKKYDRIVMNPPFENFQDIDHVKHAYSLLKPGGKVVAIMGAGVKNSRKKAVEFREWLDDMGSYIEDLPEGSFKTAERPTGVATVMVTIEKNDDLTLKSKDGDKKASDRKGSEVYHAPGHNYLGSFRSTGIPARREFVMISGKRVKIPKDPQRIEPIIADLVSVMGRRIYNGKIKGKSTQGFYRPGTGELRTRRKNDVEILAHEMAHYLDMYSNVTLPNFAKLYKDRKYVDQVKALSYTDSTPALQKIEGFAEFVRHWLTNSEYAREKAPDFFHAFERELNRDKKLGKKMRAMQDKMHKFYFQGPDNLGQALIGKNQSFSLRFNEWMYRRDSRIRQQVIDRFHAARKVEQELTKKIGTAHESAWKQFRIANGGAEGIADYVLNYGTVNFDESGDLQKTGKSLHEIFEPVKKVKPQGDDKKHQPIDLLMRYFAGRRALELHRQGRENLIPKETAITWARLGTKYSEFESIRKEYQQFNDRMMDFYQEAGLLTGEGREAMQSMNKDYVPFNRVREQMAGGPGAGGGFQRLKGGTANLNDILVNIQDGIVANTQAALSNRAKQRLYGYISSHKDGAIFATKLAPDSKLVKVHQEDMARKVEEILMLNGIMVDGEIDVSDPGLVEFWQHGVKPRLTESGNIVDSVIINGKPRYYEVQDPLLQEMLVSMNPDSYSSFMQVMFGVKNFFTRTITLGIEFMGANLVRDTVGAAFISKHNFTPFLDSLIGMKSFLTKDKYYQDFMRAGAGYSSRLEALTKEGTARRRVKLDEFGVMTVPERLLSGIDNIASAFEYGTRIGEFRLAKKAGESNMDAAFAGREISTDFSVTGANHFITGYVRTVPFLNAMIQSQDRIFREAVVLKRYGGNPAGLAMKAFLGITLPTLALYLMNKDDEDYQAIPLHERRTNWHFKIGDNQYAKIPRPYDVGFLYATMPELIFKYIEDEEGKEFADGMLWTMTQMYGIDGTPAIMTGWWDLVRNEKWTGAPVVPHALADVSAPEQYTANTSETFVRLGQALGISPIKAEHMYKAYTGYLGGYLLSGTDHMLWDESKFGEKPESQLDDNIFLRRFLVTDQRPNTAYMEKFFDLKEKSDEVVATFKKQTDVRRAIKKDTGTPFKDDTFFGLSAEEKQVLFALNDSMNDLIKIIFGKEGIKTAELAVRYNPRLTGEEKRQKIDNLWRGRNKAFMQYYNAAKKALDKAKAKAEEDK